MWRTAVALLGQLPGTPEQLDRARMVASLPMRMGGLGLRSAGRCARAAYWASWADAIPMISHRNPTVANFVVESLSGEPAPAEDCLAQLHECGQTLDREGFCWRPTWSELRARLRPPDVAEGEPGEWQHGWQFWSSSVTDASFRKLTLLSWPYCLKPGSFAVSFGEERRSRVGALPHRAGIHHPPSSLQNVVAREIALATANHGGNVPGMSHTSGPVGTPPGVVHKKWAGEEESHAHGAHDSACFPRSRRVCPTECFP